MTLELTAVACRSPIGGLVAVECGRKLVALEFETHHARLLALLAKRFGAIELVPGADRTGVAAALTDYFAGDLMALAELPADGGGTRFQARVWAALRRIPVGQTRSYAGLAAALDMPRAVRAVGHANGLNPLAIVVPCHRVIGSDGALRGYAGGLERKRWLLRHEGAPAGADGAA